METQKQEATLIPGECGSEAINGSLVAKRRVCAPPQRSEPQTVQDEVTFWSAPSLSIRLQAKCN